MRSKSTSKAKGSGHGAYVSARCHLRWLEQISERLSLANMARMRRSCFGHLFDVGAIQFQGQLYHILLRNHLFMENDSRLQFLFHDTIHEFGPVEFALITGLKFSGFYDPPPTSKLFSLCFPDQHSLRFQDIENAFHTECSRSQGHSELALQLAYLFVLYSVLLMRDRGDKNIEIKYLHLVDDLDRFDEYPWGRVSYEYLVQMTHSRKEILDKQVSEGKKPAYDAFGFVLALQVWAYEVIPDLGRYCAHNVSGLEAAFPRILRWTANEFFKYDDLMRFFPTGPLGGVRSMVVPSVLEWNRLHVLGLHERHMSPPRNYVIPVPKSSKRKVHEQSDEDKKPVRKHSRTSSPLRRSARNQRQPQPQNSEESKSPPPKSGHRGRVEEDSSSNVSLNEVGQWVRELMLRCSTLETLIRRLKCFTDLEAELSAENDVVLLGGDDEISPVAKEDAAKKPVLRSSVKKAPERAVKNSPQGVVKRPRGRPPKKAAVSALKKYKSPVKSVKKSAEKSVPRSASSNVSKGSTSGIPSTGKAVARQLFTPNPSRYDPTVPSYVNKDIKPFQAWYGNGKSKGFDDETPLPIISKTEADREWFHDLYQRRKWLTDEHIDALTNLLIWKYNRAKDRFTSGWTLIEMLGTGYLMNGTLQEVNGTLRSYVEGKFPREGGLPWALANKVVGIANVGKHWVCYALELNEQRIVIYDSNSESSDWERVSGMFAEMATFVPLLLRMTGVWDKKKRGGDLRLLWQVQQFRHPPQQKNGFDCGILALKFMECLVSGFEIERLQPDRGGIWRWEYCRELYELGRQFPAVP